MASPGLSLIFLLSLAMLAIPGSVIGVMVTTDEPDASWSGMIRIECCPGLAGVDLTTAHLRIPGAAVGVVLYDGYFEEVNGSLVLYLDTTQLPEGPLTLAFSATSSNGTTYTEAVPVEIRNQGDGGPTRFPATWWVTGLVFMGAVALTLIAVYLRRSRRPAPEDVFLMAQGGLLIRHLGPEHGLAGRDGRSPRQGDEDLVSSMLVAIQNFVEVSFHSGSEHTELTQIAFGRRTILLESTDHAVMALVVPGEPRSLDLAFFKRHMRAVLTRIEERYAGVLEGWDGDDASMPALNTILAGAFRY